MNKPSRRALRKKSRGNYEGFIRLAAEFRSTGLWLLDLPRQKTYGTCIEARDLRLPANFQERLAKWCAEHGQTRPGTVQDFDYENFGETGLQLARELKAHLGPTWYVEYGFGREIKDNDFPHR
jgi:hypothetical protein